MAFDCELFLALARDAVFAGKVLRRDAHRDIGLRIALDQAGIGHRVEAQHRHPAHRFDAGAEEGLAGAELDGARGDVDRLHRRAAEAVHRRPGDVERQVGEEADQAGDVEPLLALGEGAADDEVFEVADRNAGALDQPADDGGGKVVGPHPGERALAGEMEGRADIAGDHHVLHRALLSWSGPEAAACSATRTFLSILPIAVLGKDVLNS